MQEAETGEIVVLFKNMFPEEDIKSLGIISRGWNSTVYGINDRYILKIPLDKPASSSLEKEILVTGKVKKYISTGNIPEFVGKSKFKGITAGVYRKIQGETLLPSDPDKIQSEALFSRLGKRDIENLAMEIGNLLNEIGRIPHSCFGGNDASKDEDWKSCFRNQLRQYSVSCIPVFPEKLQEKVKKFLTNTANSIEELEIPITPIHGDFGGWNILYHNGKVTGILDWGNSGLGDPAMDISELVVSFGERFAMMAMEQCHTVDSEIMGRAAIYASLSGFMDISYGLRLGKDFLIERGIHDVIIQLR